jgi:Tfp pilus assembly pilus retraction ATPase PilT
MNTLEVSLASFVRSGHITLETAQSFSLRPEELNRLARNTSPMKSQKR